jgi:hypothetical protein
MIVEIDVMQLEIALPRSKSAKPDVKKTPSALFQEV